MIRVLALVVLLVTGCSEMRLSDFDKTVPAFLPERYFLGKTKAWGFFEDRFGKIRREFTVDIEGVVEGDRLRLDERFLYADGERQTRVWTIIRLGDGRYEGTAADVVGTATGEVNGRAMRWQYDFDLAFNGSTWRVRFDDWMLLQDDEVMLNRTTISKYGFELGTVVIFFRRVETSLSVLEGQAGAEHAQHAAE